MTMHDETVIAMIAIGIICGLSLFISIMLTILWKRTTNYRWLLSLGLSILLFVLLTAFECGLIQYL